MAKRTTVYNANLSDDEIWEKVGQKNKGLLRDFINYCSAMDKAIHTIRQYEAVLKIFFCWNCKNNEDMAYFEITKRHFINFFGWGRNTLGWSPARVANVKSTLSSLSNYIERIMDLEYPNFRNQIKNLEPINVTPVREKTVLSEDEIEKALKILVEQELYQEACFLAFAIASGCRKSEIIQIKVDFFKDENLVFDGLMYKTPKLRTKGRGIIGKVIPRYVFKEILDPYLDLWMKKRSELGIDNPYLFVVKNNNVWKEASITTLNSWASRLSKIMNKDIYCHNFRHYATSQLKRKKIPDDVIQKLFKWESVDMVKVYNDLDESEELSDFFKNFNKDNNV